MSAPKRLVSFDVETHLIQPGLAAPPLVCGSTADVSGGSERLLSADEARAAFRALITDPTVTLGGASIVYDFGVMAADNPELVDAIFAALERGSVVDTNTLEKLHAIGGGTLQEFESLSLTALEQRYLGVDRSAQKQEDAWRYRYAELDGVPLSQWPEAAVEYPRLDARGTVDVLVRQLRLGGPKMHEWEDLPGDSFGMQCRLCGAVNTGAAECPKGEPAVRHNLQCVVQEMRAGWFLRLAQIWGMRTDPLMVPGVVAEIRRKHEESRRLYFDAGIVRVRPCNKKEGEWERADDISPEWLAEARKRLEYLRATEVERYLQSQVEPQAWVLRRLEDLAGCEKALAKGRPIRFAEDKGHLKALVEAAYKGEPPLTDGGASGNRQVSTSRDTLNESGDELLEEYGEAGPNEKLLSTYVDVLEQGVTVPINPSSNSTLATQRTSYFDPNLQQLPRKGPVRECFVPRSGSLYCSVDYAALELSTLAQVCINLGLKSSMADAINAGQDLHTRLGARVLGITYEAAMQRKAAKDQVMLDLRQSMKPINFGKPGLMGPPKMVYTARKDGVYFCVGAGRSEKCSENPRVTEYGRGNSRRSIPPTCTVCLELAVEYSELWYQEWPEMRDYHEITVEVARECERGIPLESFGTGLKRLETNPNAVSNHFFQNLAAQGAKHASWLLSKEMYTDRSSVLFNNARIVVFVHDENMSEIREEVAHEAAWRKSQIMVAGMKEFVPDVRIEAEPALMRRWFKGADKALDKAGKLKPWWPKDWSWGPDQELMALDRAR